MHCGQLLQRNEENRESSEKRVDTGNADQTGIAAPRRVGGEVERAPRVASAHACEQPAASKKSLFHAGFLHIEEFFCIRSGALPTCGSPSPETPGSACRTGVDNRKKRRMGIGRGRRRQPRHSLSSGESGAGDSDLAPPTRPLSRAVDALRGGQAHAAAAGALDSKTGRRRTSSLAPQPRGRQRSSLRRSRSLTTCGLALPADAFIAWPTNQPISAGLALACATFSG